jgi:hypothetical protein
MAEFRELYRLLVDVAVTHPDACTCSCTLLVVENGVSCQGCGGHWTAEAY